MEASPDVTIVHTINGREPSINYLLIEPKNITEEEKAKKQYQIYAVAVEDGAEILNKHFIFAYGPGDWAIGQNAEKVLGMKPGCTRDPHVVEAKWSNPEELVVNVLEDNADSEPMTFRALLTQAEASGVTEYNICNHKFVPENSMGDDSYKPVVGRGDRQGKAKH